jgi:hypothetical protein
VKHELLNFGNRRVLPVARQHLCPFLNSLPAGRKAVVFSEAGYMRGPFLVSTPENDKTDKKQAAGSPLSKPPAIKAFRPASPVDGMWDAVKNMQGADAAGGAFPVATQADGRWTMFGVPRLHR